MDLNKLVTLLQKHPEAKIIIPSVDQEGNATEVEATSAYFLEDLDGNAVVRLG